MYYLKSRYYSPELGRFLTKDTFKGFNNSPQSLNLYAYCEGNPVMKVDPDGQWAVKIPLSFKSYLYLADKGWYRGRLKIYLSLYMTAGGFIVNSVLAITAGSGQLIAYALRRAGVKIGGQIAWTVANFIRGQVWRYSTTKALQLSKSSGPYAKFFWIRTYVYHVPLIV